MKKKKGKYINYVGPQKDFVKIRQNLHNDNKIIVN